MTEVPSVSVQIFLIDLGEYLIECRILNLNGSSLYSVQNVHL